MNRHSSSAPRTFWRRRRLVALIGLALASLLLSACFGEGVHPVADPLTSTQMPTGLWRSLGGDQCTWSRVQPGGGAAGRNIRTSGPQYLQVEPSDTDVAIDNCLPFWQQPGPFARQVVQPGSEFGDGDFLVGYEVAPGTYVGTAGSGQTCSFAIVQGFHGKDSTGKNPDYVRGATTSAGSPEVTIGSGDFGFTSQGCGTWKKKPPGPPATTTTSSTTTTSTSTTSTSSTSSTSTTSTSSTSSTSTTSTSSTTTTTKPPPPPDETFHVKTENFADPSVLRVDDASRCGGDPAPCYYAYSTEGGFLGFINVPVIRSSDLVNWKWAGPPAAGSTAARKDAMPTLAKWVVFGANWAPSVMWNATSSKYVMYYTAKSTAGSNGGGRQCVGVATSSAPDGPYVDSSSQPLTCPTGTGDVIDPSPFRDSTGALWLQWADNTAIRTRRLTNDGLSLAPYTSTSTLLTASASWEAGRVEAPNMIQTTDSGILLYYSGNVYWNAGYGVGVARCAAPTGPCTRISNTPVLGSRGTVYGPGGQTPFQLGDSTWRLIYHAWDSVVGYDNGGLRTLHVLAMTFSGTSPNQNPSVG